LEINFNILLLISTNQNETQNLKLNLISIPR
jgi:hypothetical protein